MSAEKLSISLDSELAAAVRAAAEDERVTVSTWLSRAAQARVRRLHLREALDAFASEHGSLSDGEIDDLLTAARRRSTVTRPDRRSR